MGDDGDGDDVDLSCIQHLTFDSSVVHPTEQAQLGTNLQMRVGRPSRHGQHAIPPDPPSPKTCIRASAFNRCFLPIIDNSLVYDSSMVHPTEQVRFGKNTYTNTHKHVTNHTQQDIRNHTISHTQSSAAHSKFTYNTHNHKTHTSNQTMQHHNKSPTTHKQQKKKRNATAHTQSIHLHTINHT